MPRRFSGHSHSVTMLERKEMIGRTSKQYWLILVPASDGRAWVGKSVARGEALVKEGGYLLLE